MLERTKTSSDAASALEARYGGNAPAPGPWSDTVALMLRHRSVRGYLDRPLPDNTLETLAAAGQSASNSSNMQSWSVVAVTEPERKQRLAEASQNQHFIAECPLFLCFVADLSRAARVAERHDMTLSALPLLEIFTTAATDCAIAAQNIALAAESLGLAVCYVGALRNDPERVASELNLPQGTAALFGLCIGYEDPARATAIKPRLPQAVVFHREVYSTEREEELLAQYDTVFKAFGGAYRRSEKNWAQRVHDRLGNADYLNGREHLKSALEARGFGLK